MSVPSEVIKRSKSIDYSKTDSDFWSIQNLEQYLMMSQKIAFKYLDLLGKYTMLFFPLSREKMMVELGIAISVSIRFGGLF